MEQEHKDFLERIINWTFPGLTFYYRDTNLTGKQLSRYEVGRIMRNGFFTDVASTAGKPTQNTRFIIASSKAAPVYQINPDVEKWRLHVLNVNSYFKVLDIYAVEDHNQILLLHIPARALDFFAGAQTNFEEDFIAKARESFNAKYRSEILAVFQEKEWIDRTSFAVGLDENDNYFPIPPTPLPPKLTPLINGLKQMSNDTDDLNVFDKKEMVTDKKSFWDRIFN